MSWVLLWCPRASAQTDVDSTGGSLVRPRYMLEAIAITAAAIEDRRIAAFAHRQQRPAFNHAASALDPFGRAGTLVPALALAVLIPRVADRRSTSDAALRIALAYAAADGVESILKPAIGRHRPDDGGGAWRFHPFSGDGDWHSLPSAHTVHVFSLATALGIESRTRWVSVPSFAVATLVGMERVYKGEHWSSDVVASAVLATSVSRVVERAVRTHGLRGVLEPVHR